MQNAVQDDTDGRRRNTYEYGWIGRRDAGWTGYSATRESDNDDTSGQGAGLHEHKPVSSKPAAVTRPSIGVTLLGMVALGNLVLWIVAHPSGQPWGRYVGEILGVESVLLFSAALVLATLLSPIERAFGGLDRVAQWHRHAAVAGVVLMLLHPTFAGSTPVPDVSAVGLGIGSFAMLGLVLLALWSLAPSLRAARWSKLVRRLAALSHERWLSGHRLTGLFVTAAVVHGAMVDPVLRESNTLKVTYLIIGGIGIVAYLYRELIARFVVPIYDFTVAEIKRPNDTTVDVFLEPVGKPLAFKPGQFIFLAFGGVNGWERHPFSAASAPDQRRLEVSIRAAGDYTTELNQKLQPGTPAKAAGPFGEFDYHAGGHQQIWIAGGVGVTPFISWIRSLDADFDRNVEFYYSVKEESEAIYVDEINAAAAAHPSFRPHIVDTSRDGFLTADRTVTGLADHADAWVYMCGPPPMMTAMAKQYESLGIGRQRVRWEQFNVR